MERFLQVGGAGEGGHAMRGSRRSGEEPFAPAALALPTPPPHSCCFCFSTQLCASAVFHCPGTPILSLHVPFTLFFHQQELEEDADMRARVALYKDPAFNPAAAAPAPAGGMADSGDRGGALLGCCGDVPPWLPSRTLQAAAPRRCPTSRILLYPTHCVPSLPFVPASFADEEDGDVPQVPLEELLEDLAALGLDGERERCWGFRGGQRGAAGASSGCRAALAVLPRSASSGCRAAPCRAAVQPAVTQGASAAQGLACVPASPLLHPDGSLLPPCDACRGRGARRQRGHGRLKGLTGLHRPSQALLRPSHGLAALRRCWTAVARQLSASRRLGICYPEPSRPVPPRPVYHACNCTPASCFTRPCSRLPARPLLLRSALPAPTSPLRLLPSP